MTAELSIASRRTVRCAEAAARRAGWAANAIEELYEDRLDVMIARAALPASIVVATAARLDDAGRDPGWSRPNEKAPLEDVQLLGTDTPATPTFRDPRGATLAQYLEGGERHRGEADRVFPDGFRPAAEIGKLLANFSGGRPVEVARAADGRSYTPFTVRRLTAGKQLGVHHDYHYALPLYQELTREIDTGTLVSYVITLQKPLAGGQLVVYGVTPTTPDAPKMPNGFQWDLAAIEQRYELACLDFEIGDLFLLAAGRCLHRVQRVEGPRARITLGGFLALDKARERVLFWS